MAAIARASAAWPGGGSVRRRFHLAGGGDELGDERLATGTWSAATCTIRQGGGGRSRLVGLSGPRGSCGDPSSGVQGRHGRDGRPAGGEPAGYAAIIARTPRWRTQRGRLWAENHVGGGVTGRSQRRIGGRPSRCPGRQRRAAVSQVANQQSSWRRSRVRRGGGLRGDDPGQ